MAIEFVARLSRRRWTLPVLAAIGGGVPARLPVLAARLGGSRGGVTEALAALIGMRLVAHVPPPRHPLQPELALTHDGAAVAAVAVELLDLAGQLGVAALLRDRWALPVLAAIVDAPRFNQLRRLLAPVSDRALALTLAGLADHALIGREVVPARPPETRYRLLAAGQAIAALVDRLPCRAAADG